MATSSAAERRRQRNLAIVRSHPRWQGIRHPDLIAFAPRRFSRLDMLPAEQRRRSWADRLPPLRPTSRRTTWEERAERNRAVVAAHPQWHRILHPERILFPAPPDEDTALLAYRRAVRLAVAHLRESEQIYRRIATVADSLGRRSWSWSANPAAAASEAGVAPTPLRTMVPEAWKSGVDDRRTQPARLHNPRRSNPGRKEGRGRLAQTRPSPPARRRGAHRTVRLHVG